MIALVTGEQVRGVVIIFGLTALAMLVVVGIGALVLWRWRRRSLRFTMMVVAMAPMAAALVATALCTIVMFVNREDSLVMVWTLSFSGMLGITMSMVLARRIRTGSLAVGARLRTLGTDGPDSSDGERDGMPYGDAPAELAELTDELEATRQRLAASRERERALETSRRELVAFMSHDLRTPLAGLRALSEGVEDGVIEDVPGALRQMRTTVDRMNGLVDDLFELSRLSATPPPRRRAAVSLRELADDVAAETSEHARSQGVSVAVRVPSGYDRLAVHGDADELTRAVTNLVGNAIRHTGAGGTVELTVDRESDGRVRLAVTDACGGIPAGELDRVFDIGWRGDRQRTPDGAGGGGLGLAIARGVVESHDGTIAVSNVPGGCAFRIDLPRIVLAREDAARPEAVRADA